MQLLVFVLLILVVILLCAVILGFLFLVLDLFFELPYVATKKDKIQTMLDLAQIKKGETVVDLGSGDGRLLFAAAQKGAIAIGYEINPVLVLLTRLRARFLGYSSSEPELVEGESRSNSSRLVYTEPRSARTVNEKGMVIVKKQNFWKADLKVADVIFVYAYRKTMQKFKDFIYKNAKGGTRIIVNTNPFPSKQAVKSENGIFLYIK